MNTHFLVIYRHFSTDLAEICLKMGIKRVSPIYFKSYIIFEKSGTPLTNHDFDFKFYSIKTAFYSVYLYMLKFTCIGEQYILVCHSLIMIQNS